MPTHSPPPSFRSSRAMRATGGLCLFVAFLAGCSDLTGTAEKPTTAQLQIEGTSPVPLRLVISTDFFEVIDTNTGEPRQIFNSADTTFVEPPFSDAIDLTALGSIVIELSNQDDDPANVRMQVQLDTGQPGYDQSAMMSEGGTLRYVFRYLTFS